MSRSQCAIGALAVAVLLLSAGCGRNDQGGESRRSTVSTRTEEMCRLTEVERDHRKAGETFTDLIEGDPEGTSVRGAAAGLALLRSRFSRDLGPYGPALDHLIAIGRAQARGSDRLPTVDEAVRRSARRLDRDLAAGACKD
jgi:hypothetical protein